jgi:GH25 family lysozyme M1 (1,4-beta-N-acetylmuramidase)
MHHLRMVALAGVLSACAPTMVGDDPDEDAVAGDGIGVQDDDAQSDVVRTCADGPTVKGIDVSYYQGVVDWNRVKAAGIDFAFIRVSDGEVFKDPKFTNNWSGARSAGVIRGAYQFFRPNQNIAAQARIMIDAIGEHQPGDLPPVLDVEATGGVSAKNLATKIGQWVDQVEAEVGVKPIIYTGKYFWRDQVGGSTAFEDHPLWIAHFTALCPSIPAPWSRWTFHQHSEKGKVAGITGNVDLDNFNGTLAELQAFAAGGSPSPGGTSEALPFFWQVQTDGSHTFVAEPPAAVTRVEIRVDNYLIGGAAVASGRAIINYSFTDYGLGRAIDVRGLDSTGTVVALGNGLVDTTADPEVRVDMFGPSTYEIGTENPYYATVEVFADGFALVDSVTGLQRSTRGIVRFTFTQTGVRNLRIVTRDSSGAVIADVQRSLNVL